MASKQNELEFSLKNSKFNDPFLLNSNLYIPTNFYTALEFSLYLAIKNPVYTQATKRTVSHFITDYEFVGTTGDQKEKKDLREYLIDSLEGLEALQQGGLEQFIYGNSFLRIHYPFTRYLIDRRGGGYRQIALDTFGDDIKFELSTMTYSVPDPLTLHLAEGKRKRVSLEFIDRKSYDATKIKLRFLDPKQMSINMNFISGNCEYIYRFEEFFRAAVKKGDPIHQINETPMDMLLAIKNDQDFAFNEGAIFHFKQPFISGLSLSGWGIPNILLNYSSIHQLQVLRCINEAVGLDYITPFRLISPTPTQGQAGADAASATNLGRWTSAMQQLIHNKRMQPTALHTTPFPVTYQELGSNKNLAPVDLLQYHQDEMLTGMGYPAELWKMSLQTQQIPTAIRMFESTFIHLQRNFNNATRWIVKNVLNYLEKEQIGVKLQLPSVADDMEKKHIWLQLASGGEVSRATAYRAFNIDDPIAESRRRAQEDIEIQKLKQQENEKFEREMTLGSANQIVDAMVQSQGGPGGVTPGGAPPPGGGGGGGMVGGGNQSVTPLDIAQQAEEQAMQLLQIEDVGERRKMMNSLKASAPVLYDVTLRKMEEMRQQGASQGRKSVGKQQG